MTKAELYQKACMLPLLPGEYIIRDKSDTIIYIGKAKRLRIRVSQYFREGVPHDNKVSQMIAHAYAFDVIDSSLLVGAIGDDADGGSAHDAQRQDAQKALSVHAALFLLDPDGRLELIGLLNKGRHFHEKTE